MDLNRRDVIKLLSVPAALAVLPGEMVEAGLGLRHTPDGWVRGHMTGAQALVETLLTEGVDCVFGIPGAQENELWDVMKSKHLNYLLVTHEFSAAAMADGYARSTGRVGVLCVVPGPGLTNSLTGLGEALLDSIPIVCIVGDVANGCRGRPFQVHCLNNPAILQPVTKRVITVQTVGEIPQAIHQAFCLARGGEPGPVGVVVPWNLFIEADRFNCPPLPPLAAPFDEAAFHRALALLSDRRLRVGIYAGQGCMDYSPALVRVAELLQAPVATSMAGKGVMPECHPLAVGWGYGAQGTRTAENMFGHVDLVLAIGVKYSEVSTGFYSDPQSRYLIHVDINPESLGRIMQTTVCVNADAGVFLSQVQDNADMVRRDPDGRLIEQIRLQKLAEARINDQGYARCGIDPMVFLRALRCATAEDALCFVDVTVSQYWATEVFTIHQPRTFFNPTNNQGMGWSIPAALGAQAANHGRQVVTVTGDGCFLMSGMEISTAAREGLPVKFFVLDDQAYHYMQELQRPAYMRTTATILARLDYRALAIGWGVGYRELNCNDDVEAHIRGILEIPGPVLIRVVTDYTRRPIRWIQCARRKFTNELTRDQRLRFAARIGTRALDRHPDND